MNSTSNNSSKKLQAAGFFIALGVLLPLPFHLFGIGESIFLPMHFPVLISGFYLGGLYGLLIGAITPWINHLILDFPAMDLSPMAIIMMFELGAYGLFSGVLFKKTELIWGSLVASMAGGRFIAGLAVWILILAFDFQNLQNPMNFLGEATFTGLPGITLQLFIIPLFVSRLN